MRNLPHCDQKESSEIKDLYTSMQERLEKDQFIDNFPKALKFVLQKDDDQINDIMQKLTGLGIEIGGLLDEDQTLILEPDKPMTTASERAKWNWVTHTWDKTDLYFWEKLTDPDLDPETKEMKWKAPVPVKSTADLLYNSKRIVDGLPNPKKWDDYGNRTGLVLGSVQSGKTASMLGVSAIAMDPHVGYKIIIVLAGHTENLRAQTFNRFQVFQEIMGRNVTFPVMGDKDLENVEASSEGKGTAWLHRSSKDLCRY